MAPVRVDIVRVMDVCDRSLRVEEVLSSVFEGEIRPVSLAKGGSAAVPSMDQAGSSYLPAIEGGL